MLGVNHPQAPAAVAAAADGVGQIRCANQVTRSAPINIPLVNRAPAAPAGLPLLARPAPVATDCRRMWGQPYKAKAECLWWGLLAVLPLSFSKTTQAAAFHQLRGGGSSRAGMPGNPRQRLSPRLAPPVAEARAAARQQPVAYGR